MVSRPVSKAARHFALRAGERRVVTSQRRAHEQGVMMDCCRRAAACAVTVSTEVTARRVNEAPSPVSGYWPNSDSTSSTVRNTDSRHCVGKAAHDHILAVDTHINFSIEDYGRSWSGRWPYLWQRRLQYAYYSTYRWAHRSGPRLVYALPLAYKRESAPVRIQVHISFLKLCQALLRTHKQYSTQVDVWSYAPAA
jgi:hypothetical protein